MSVDRWLDESSASSVADECAALLAHEAPVNFTWHHRIESGDRLVFGDSVHGINVDLPASNITEFPFALEAQNPDTLLERIEFRCLACTNLRRLPELRNLTMVYFSVLINGAHALESDGFASVNVKVGALVNVVLRNSSISDDWLTNNLWYVRIAFFRLMIAVLEKLFISSQSNDSQ